MPTRRELANAIRALSIDAIEKANSGHPGAPLGMADMAEALWRHYMKFNPADPDWPDRDRFILSNGHASMMIYALLHLTGFELSMEDIKNFRQFGSRTPGHPEHGTTSGVEMSTGPLGQGLASAVGFALAEALLAQTFNRPNFKIVDHFTYAFCGDGCLMEGVSQEACSLAGTWHLGKLVVFYDSNGVSIDGPISSWFSENVAQRFASCDWQVIGPVDGHDFDALDKALAEARANTRQPTIIVANTHIGFGSPKRDTSASHGAPLGEKAAKDTRENLGWQSGPFVIPPEILAAWDMRKKGAELEGEWKKLFASYEKEYPDLAAEFKRRMAGELPKDWKQIASGLMRQANATREKAATRVDSRECLEYLVPRLPELIGGSADLSASVGAITKSSRPLNTENYEGNYIYYGAREFGMGAIMNGLALHGGFIPYAGTFLAFSDQAKNALRLSALMNLRVIWIMTHDSIGVGEDGPTHQPVEQIPTLRLIPRLLVWRPCDADETAVAWIAALESGREPTCLILSRQSLPQFEHDGQQLADMAKGGYILHDCAGQPELILIATGSEAQLALAAAGELEKEGHKCRVISMPCAQIFDRQSREYREKVLPPAITSRLALEAASGDWWRKYVGLDGDVIGMDDYGASAPGSLLFKHFGFTVENVVKRAKQLLAGGKKD